MECLGAAIRFLQRSGSQKSPHSAEIIQNNLLHNLQQKQIRTNPNSLFGVRFSSDGLNVLTAGISVTPQQCLSAPSMIQANFPCLETSGKSCLSKSYPNDGEFPIESPTLHPRHTASKSRFHPYVKPAPLRELNQNTINAGMQARSNTTTVNTSTFCGYNQDSLSLLSSSSLDVRKQQFSKAASPRSKAAKEEEEVWRPF